MKFKYEEYHHNVTDEELIADMKRVFNSFKLDKLTQNEYSLRGKFDCSTIIRHFGSWNKALFQANIPVANQFWSEEDLFNNLESVWIKKGTQPRRRDMDDKNLSSISSGAYKRRFGSWSNALIAFISYINEDDNSKYIEPLSEDNETKHHKTKRDINLRLRFRVLQRDNFKCCACGASPAKDSSVVLHVDHITPWSKGGETEISNLQTLCDNCNLGKSNIL